MKRLTLLLLVLLMGVAGLVSADKPIGVFANSNTNSIQFIYPSTDPTDPNAVSDPYLKGDLGSYGGGLFDVVITSDGKTVIVSNFGDSTIFFIDISEYPDVPPPVPVYIGFFAEDMAITPGDEYLLVTDGGFSSQVAFVDIGTRELVSNQYLGANRYANAVAISPDGTLVLFADYFLGAIHSYALNGTTLTFRETQLVLPARPVNVAISPDGQTVIGVNAGSSIAPIFLIDSQQNLCFQEFIPLPSMNGQSCIFNKKGDKAYYLSNSQNKGTMVHILNVTAPGKVSASSTSISLYPPMGTSQLFGVDTIALDPEEEYLYVSNPTLSGGLTGIFIINLDLEVPIGYIPAYGIPTGIAFTTANSDDHE